MNKIVCIAALVLATVPALAAELDLDSEVVKLATRKRGICAVIGGDGKLALALARDSEFLVYCRVGAREVLKPVAQAAREEGLLNRRIYIEHGTLNVAPLADNYADLLIVGEDAQLPGSEVERVVSIGGSVLEMRGSEFEMRHSGSQLPEGADDWPHWFYGPDNNPVSSDSALKWPFLLQWLAKPYDGAQPKVTVVASGRAFCASGEAYSTYHSATASQKEDAHTLKAINVFNGQVLWTRKIPIEDQVGRPAFIATHDTFYMIERHRILCLDAETGSLKQAIDLGGPQRMPKWIALNDGVLFAMLGGPESYDEKWRKGQKYPIANLSNDETYSPDRSLRRMWGFGDEIVAYDLKAGRPLWSHREGGQDIDGRQIAFADDHIFYHALGKRVVCLNTADGNIVWINETDEVKNALAPDARAKYSGLAAPRSSLVCSPDAVFVNYPGAASCVALSARDGHLLWKTAKPAAHVFFDTDGVHITGSSTMFFNPLTGESTGKGIGASGCGPVLVSEHGYFGRHGMSFDRIKNQDRHQHTFRGGCWQDCIPANGLLVTAPYVCSCNYSLRGWNVQAPAGAFPFGQQATDAKRLETFLTAAAWPLDFTAGDWPTHRANNRRSGFVPVEVPARSRLLWTATASGHGLATPAVAVGDFVFVAGDDGVVRALSAADGTTRWEFATTGRIHAAPTVDGGRVYAGSADGFVYALDATSGRLLWRFRAAPAERRIMTYGHLSSTWPVNTGTLVADGVLYAGAGLMDSNGTHVYALDAATGKIKWQNNTCGHLNEEQHKGVLAHGNLTMARGKLWMCAGSSCAIASFDVADGSCTIPVHANGTFRNGNRGREIGLFADNLIIHGGQPLHLDQPGERMMQRGCEMTYTRLDPNGRMTMPPVIPYDATAALPVWDGESLLTPHVVSRDPRIVCVETAPLRQWIGGLQAAREDTFSKRQSWMPVTFSLVERVLPTDEIVSRRPTPAWEMAMKRDAMIYALALTGNAVVAVVSSAPDGWRVVTLDRVTGDERWTHPLSAEPLFNGLCVNRKGSVLVTLTDAGIMCFGQ